MTDVNALVYETVEGKTASSLDRFRGQFFSLTEKMQRKNPKIKIEKVDKSFTFYSGIPLAFFNQAVMFDGSKESFEKAFQIVNGWNIKNCFLLGGAGLSLANQLSALGYTNSGASPVMCYAVDERYSEFELRDGLVAVRTENPEQFDINVQLLVSAFGLSEEVVRGYTTSLLYETDCFRYVLFDNGVPVNTSLFMKTGDFVGCFDVATPTEHQRKGYGEELMKYMLRQQFELGSKLVALQSSAAGEALYRRMGFQIIEYLQSWISKTPE